MRLIRSIVCRRCEVAGIVQVAIAVMLTAGMTGESCGQAWARRGIEPDLPPLNGRARITYSLRPMLTIAEVEHYALSLHMTDSQLPVCRVFFERYQSKCLEHRAKVLPKIDELSIAAAEEQRTRGHTPQFVDLVERFLQAQKPLGSFMNAREEEFFSELATILATSQLELLPRVRLKRLRARHLSTNVEIPSARLDLTWMCDQSDLSQSGREAIDPILREYETIVTPKFVALDELLLARVVPSGQAMAKGGYHEDGSRRDFSLPETVEIAAIADAERESAHRPAAMAQIEIESLNEQYLEQILQALGEPGGKLSQTYAAEAFPHVHPDPVDFTRPMRRLCHADLAPDLRAQVAAIIGPYDQEYSKLTRAMEQRSKEWAHGYAVHRSTRRLEEYRADMRELQASRWRIGLEALRQICVSVPVTQESCAQIRSQMQAEVASETAMIDEHAWPSAAPWLGSSNAP